MAVAENFIKHFGYESLTLQNCYNFIRPRETESEDGFKYSEWIVDFES